MINVIASIHVKVGCLPEFTDILKTNVPNVLNETGCMEYLPTVDAQSGLPSQHLEENVVTIIEKWRSLKDLRAHITAPHMLRYKDRVKNLVDKVYIKVLSEL